MFYNKEYSRNVRQREKVDLTFVGKKTWRVLIKQYQMILPKSGLPPKVAKDITNIILEEYFSPLS